MQSPHERFLHLVHKTVFLFDRHADRLLAEGLGSTFSQFLILLAVTRHPGLSQSHIAAFLNLTPAAVSRMVDALVESKLLVRTQDPASRRTYRVHLSPEGTKKFVAMQSLLEEQFKKSVGSVPDEELQLVSDTLAKLLTALDPHFAYCKDAAGQPDC